MSINNTRLGVRTRIRSTSLLSLAASNASMTKLIDTAGNQNHLTTEGETFRWQTESKMVVDGSKGQPLGLVDPALLKAEVDAYRAAGVFESPVSMDGTYNADLVAGVYDAAGKVVWPS